MANDSGRRSPPRLMVETLQAGAHVLSADNSHYVLHVLRLRPGAPLWLFDGGGRHAHGQITAVDSAGKTVHIDVQAPTQQPPQPLDLTIALASPKGERADWVVEKLTELGVRRILWVHCARSVVLPKPSGNKQQRWQRLAEAAAKQCRRADTPLIDGPVGFASLMQEAADWRLLAQPGGGAIADVDALAGTKGLVVIGPEGGLTSEEVALAQGHGFLPVSLGPWVLRIETAALSAASCLMASALKGQSAVEPAL